MQDYIVKILRCYGIFSAILSSVTKSKLPPYSKYCATILSVFLITLLAACTEIENVIPTVNLLRPQSNAIFSENATIQIMATAADTDGQIERVTFFVNGIGSVDTSPPYQLDLDAKDLGVGFHQLSIRAYDNTGASSSPKEISFSIRPAESFFEVNTVVTGSGTVVSNPTGIRCSGTCTTEFILGTSINLSAIPASGSTFKGWNGDCTGSGACTLDADANITAIFNSGSSEGPTDPFTFVFLPDTQHYVCSSCRKNDPDTERWQPDTFKAQTQWVVNNLESENIAFVANAGDVVQTATELEEWEIADAAYSNLDSVVPYSVIPGDHDYFPEEYRNGDTTYYRQFFGASRYQNYSWYGGSSPSGLSHYQRFTGGGQDFIHIGLEFEPPGPISDPGSTLGWAKSILEANPDTPTIFSTHAYLMDAVNRRSEPRDQEACYKPNSGVGTEPCPDKPGTLDPNASSGEEIFQALIKPSPQVFMVLNGHYYRSDTSNTGPTSDSGEYHQVSLNEAGLPVYEMLANYQNYDNGGDGWIRLIEFIPDGGSNGQDRIQIRTYSPTRGDFQPGEASNFFFDLSFAERLGTP